MENEGEFFKNLGACIRKVREKRGHSQEDMINYGFSLRFWQKIEAGKPITMKTLFRICRVFNAPMHAIIRCAETTKRR